MKKRFRDWWMNRQGSEQWAKAVDGNILDAIEMVFNSGMGSASDIAEEAVFLDAVVDTQLATAELIRKEIT